MGGGEVGRGEMGMEERVDCVNEEGREKISN